MKVMNDLTKEELRKLLHGLGLINNIPCMVLENKLQSIIDDYPTCIHKEVVTGAYPRSNPPKKCDVCGVRYYE